MVLGLAGCGVGAFTAPLSAISAAFAISRLKWGPLRIIVLRASAGGVLSYGFKYFFAPINGYTKRALDMEILMTKHIQVPGVWALGMASLLLFACKPENPENKLISGPLEPVAENDPERDTTFATFDFEPYLAPCHGFIPMECYVHASPESKRGHLFYGPIEGFQFAWGIRSTLTVAEIPIPNPPMDAPSLRYIVQGQIRTVAKPDWKFLTILRDSLDISFSSDTLTLAGYSRRILVASAEDQKRLTKATLAAPVQLEIQPHTGDILFGRVIE